MSRHGVTSLFMLLLAGASARAAAQSLPPVRPLGPVVARSTEPLGSVATAVTISGGRVLVNDILKRRVLLFDSTFANAIVVADSTASTANAYGARIGGLISYRGDSTLFIDPASMSMLVIDANGKIARVMSAPRPQDVGFLIGGPNGVPGFDAKGRLVYRGQARPVPAAANAKPAVAGFVIPQQPDSAPIVRFDLETRKLDTAAFYKITKLNLTVTQTANGGINVSAQTNPLPTVDDWALLSDGSIAVVRGKDYHIDFVGTDGAISSTAKVPYDWERLDDDGKAAVLDSARAALEKARAMARAAAAGGPMPAGIAAMGGTEFMIGRGGPPPPGAGGDVRIQMGRGGDAGPVPRPADGGRGADPGKAADSAKAGGAGKVATGDAKSAVGDAKSAVGGAQIQMPAINMVPASELPDYRPPFNAGASRGDAAGNLWVRTTSPVGTEGPIYYVINRSGEVIDRVQVPQQRLIAGFGANGVVYLSVRDADGNVRLERAKIR